MVNLGIIGCGYWGINLVRNYLQTDDCTVKTVCESSPERQNYVKEIYGDLNIISDYNTLLEDPEIDAVVISTPAGSHYEIAKKSLLAGKHTFVEKPLSLKYAHASELVELAKMNNKVLMVGHTVIYNESIKMVKELVSSGEIGEIYYIYASRLNLGRVRSDVNVMWNLAPHDISVILYLLDRKPVSVSAKGLSYIQNRIEDVVYLNITFENAINAQLHLSWLDPNKKREITIVGSKKMLVYDDNSDERIKIYDRGIDKQNKNEYFGEYKDYGEYQLIQRAGDVVIPKVNLNEPLKNECRHFIECIAGNKEPLTSGRSALDVIKILETADRSLGDAGKEILIN
ncbi:MAG: Gfo/Idh/MocA family oxidoreductase [Ignavibacteria bacterium]|jgi:predicted dehydrogenase